ncbi:MAG: L,D-transpeptidase [Actinobacteria bacterium]|nr:MAG: L,D-transpeptidase [Actinomycetota bacterium]
MKLFIDDKEVSLNHTLGKNDASYNQPGLLDGKHTARIEIVDAANNTSDKKWAFNVDTTRLVLRQSQFTLYVYKAGKVIKSVRVAVGQPEWPTPMGTWKVVGKDEMPWWHNPHKSWSASMPESIPPGVSNPLGLRAMYLSAEAVAIHGTSNYGSIGTAASHGCIRVANSDVVGLYPFVPVGAPVEIVP